MSVLSLTQMKHFVFGFIGEPDLHLKAFANSLEFDKVPTTLRNNESVYDDVMITIYYDDVMKTITTMMS